MYVDLYDKIARNEFCLMALAIIKGRKDLFWICSGEIANCEAISIGCFVLSVQGIQTKTFI